MVYQLFEPLIKKHGLTEAIRKLQETFGVRVKVMSQPKGTADILEKGPVLIVANHPWDQEPVALLSTLPNRKDIFLIASHRLKKFEHLGQHILPVNIALHQKESDKRSLSVILGKLRRMPKASLGLAKSSVRSLALASEKLNQGGIVLIFPQGVYKDNKWQQGIDRVVRDVDNLNAKMVFSHIKNTSNWDYLRFIPVLGRLIPDIEISFSGPLELPARIDSESLRLEYVKWVSSLQK